MHERLLLLRVCPVGEYLTWWLKSVTGVGGDLSVRTLSFEMFWRRVGLDGMPGCLEHFHREIGHVIGSLDDLVSEHTEFNLRCCGLPEHRHAEQRARLLRAVRGPVRMARLPVMFEPGEHLRRYCPECAREQIDEFGFTFVDRTVNAPFVNVCAKHGIELLPAPGCENSFVEACQGSRDKYQLMCERDLSARTLKCIESPATESGYSKDVVMKLLVSARWRNDNGRFVLAQLLDTFTRFFDGAFADKRLCALVENQRLIEGALRNLADADSGLHPVWCLLFRTFAEQCELPVGRACRVESKPRGELPDERRLRELLREHRTLQAVAKTIHISSGVLTLLCKRYGIERRWCSKRLNASVMSDIEKSLALGLSVGDICTRLHVSPATVYRLTAAHELKTHAERALVARVTQAKATWLVALAEHPGYSTTQIRRLYGATYMTLRRNAASWLDEHLPTRPLRVGSVPRTSSPELVKAMTVAVRGAQADCAAPGLWPPRISVYRVRTMVFATERAIGAYKRANGALETESRQQFLCRRIERLRLCGQLRGRNINTLGKRANLRPSSVQEYFSAAKKKGGGGQC
ncbi:hypothetical protein LXM60_00625 [Pandoraea sputorum]|uniref:TnsD family Tn7-like transposition protein n=1 Tax=Pandoraea sputorum TaxID=93222 RepID=UPI001E4847C3|nr:TnsD family Tn7-like transposition protein [Pandoraea sputorum]MCE4058713.1 hypothetical protein [Pandoraea sputorum]